MRGDFGVPSPSELVKPDIENKRARLHCFNMNFARYTFRILNLILVYQYHASTIMIQEIF